MEIILITTKKELAETIREVMLEILEGKELKTRQKSLTIHQVAKRLGRADVTIKRYVEKGIFGTTADGRIPESEIEKFLSNEKY